MTYHVIRNLALWLVGTFCLPLALSSVATSGLSAADGPKLRLDLQFKGERYCAGDVDGGTLQLTYALRFVNTRLRPMILSKGAGPILEILAAHDRAGLLGPAPQYRLLSTNVILHTLPLDSARPGPEAVILGPGRSYSVREIVAVPVSKNPPSPAFLASGDYFLQIAAETWSDSEELGTQQRERWKGWGYLWTEPIKSEPTQIRIAANHKMANCH